MSKLPLTFACGLYDRMLALHTGEVQVEGVDLNFLVDDNPRNIFDRMAAGQEFDAAEFSSSEYVSRFVAKAMPVRRHSGVRLARVPAQLHLRQQEAHQVAEGPRRQAHRRAGLHHDRRDLHPRPPERRARHRLLQERMGRGRHQQRQAARQPDHPADREEALDQRQQIRQVAEQDAGGRRTAGDHRHRRAGGVRPQSRYRAALSRLPRGRDRLLQAHQDLPDHAHRGDPPRRA